MEAVRGQKHYISAHTFARNKWFENNLIKFIKENTNPTSKKLDPIVFCHTDAHCWFEYLCTDDLTYGEFPISNL